MKSKQEKRNEAQRRVATSTYANSRAKRTGSATQEQWEAKKRERLNAFGKQFETTLDVQPVETRRAIRQLHGVGNV